MTQKLWNFDIRIETIPMLNAGDAPPQRLHYTTSYCELTNIFCIQTKKLQFITWRVQYIYLDPPPHTHTHTHGHLLDYVFNIVSIDSLYLVWREPHGYNVGLDICHSSVKDNSTFVRVQTLPLCIVHTLIHVYIQWLNDRHTLKPQL